jgi:hypothetical protein
MHGQSGSVQGRAGLSRRDGPDMWMLTPTVVRFLGRVERGRRLSLVTMAALCFVIIAQESNCRCGRFTLTQSSWTELDIVPAGMSGHAALMNTRWPDGNSQQSRLYASISPMGGGYGSIV